MNKALVSSKRKRKGRFQDLPTTKTIDSPSTRPVPDPVPAR
jgi:hypothetical protein